MGPYTQLQRAGGTASKTCRDDPSPQRGGGRIDQLVVDGKRKRLFAATLGEKQIAATVIDLKSNTVIRIIAGADRAQGAFYSAESKKLLVANGSGETYDVFSPATFNLVDTISSGSDTKNFGYDPVTKFLYIGGGDAKSGTLSVLDSRTNRLTREIKTEAQPGVIASSKTRPQIFMTFSGTGNVGVVDRKRHKQVATWLVPGAETNAALALDDKHHHLFVGSRKPPLMTVLSAETGQTISQIEGVEGIRDLWYDAAHQRVYASGLSEADEGLVFVYQRKGRDHYDLAWTMPTVTSSGPSVWVSECNRLYVAAPSDQSERSRILVFEPLQ